MSIKKSSVVLATAASIALSGGLVDANMVDASAAGCQGVSTRQLESADLFGESQTWNIKINSCRTAKLIDSYGQVKDGAGLAGLLGAKWWPAGTSGGVLFAWAWANQNSLKKCAEGGTGVQFKEINGFVVSCSPQR